MNPVARLFVNRLVRWWLPLAIPMGIFFLAWFARGVEIDWSGVTPWLLLGAAMLLALAWSLPLAILFAAVQTFVLKQGAVPGLHAPGAMPPAMQAEDAARRDSARRHGRAALWAGASAAITLAAIFTWWGSVGVFSMETFDSARWSVQEGERDGCYRGRMANDVQDRLLAPGLKRENVEALLGRPDAAGSTPAAYRYPLGACGGLWFGHASLEIRFDADNRLAGTAVIRD